MNQDILFGQIVKEHRRSLGLTQAELARRVGCATVTVRKIEYDTLRPSQQIAELLAKSLGVPLEERATFVRLARTAASYTPEPSPLPTPPPTPEEIGLEDLSGRAIRGYDLGERVGSGGFGAVYRAVQPLVEREVAIKIILPKYADHPDFIRRFEAEAQLVARLEHPHIVPLYDYWREPGVAYLVMRLLRGGSLAHMLKGGPLELETALQLLEQIGAALHAAHRQGVIHRDLKPANVLLDEDGNGYLADFGIAKNLSDPDLEGLTQAGMLVGSPAYASPEQIRSESVKPQADIYCLGVLLYEMLAGRQPFQGPTPIDYIQQHLNQPLPPLETQPALDPVVRRATVKEPLERYPDVPSLLVEVRQVLSEETPVVGVVEAPYGVALPDEALENPYKGLRPFGEADADDFFGRDTLIQELLGYMAQENDLSRFLAVVGPSGSGKSSAVKAGLIPALRRGGLPGSENWFVVDFLPGAHPLEELEAALLRIAVNPPESLLTQLREDERGLLRAVRRVLPSDPEVELVLVIDQFEEVFTQASARGSARGVADEAVRAHLLDSLVTATLDPRSRLRLVVTLRADFTDRPLQYVDFGELVRQRTAFVLPLTPDELEEAIVGPTRRAGLALEPGLVATVVQDVGGQPGMLPLLQYALTELFERRQGRRLTLAAYQDSGGVSGALARRAEELYDKLDGAGREAARQLFLRLITLGEGVEDTRRRVPRAELAALTQPVIIGGDLARNTQHESRTSPIDTVIEQFGRYRLLTFDHDPATRGPTVEVAHEALLREWGRLRGWLEESRADVRMQRLLAAATAEWQGAGREPSYLLRGARLAQFEGWAEGSQVSLTGDERAYLEAGVAARETREAEEAERQRRELETARKLVETEKARAEIEKARAESESRRATMLRRGAVALGGLALIAVVLAIVALAAQQQADRNADTARDEADQRATAEAIAVLEGQAAQDEANNRATAEAEARAEADLRATAEAGALLQASVGLAARAEAELDGTSPERGVLLALEALEYYPYTPQAESALARAVRESLPYTLLASAPSPGSEGGMALSPDGKYLAGDYTGYEGGLVAIIWDVDTASQVQRIMKTTEEMAGCSTIDLTWSPSGDRLVTSRGSTGRSRCYALEVWDVETGALLLTLAGHRENGSGWVDWSPDGSAILSTGDDGTAKIWNANTGDKLLTISATIPISRIMDAVWSPDSDRIAVALQDKTAQVWQLPDLTGDVSIPLTMTIDKSTGTATSAPVLILSGHTAPLTQVDWSPDGQRLATASEDGTVRIWSLAEGASGEELRVLFGHSGTVRALDWSPDGQRLATADLEGTIRVWHAASGVQELQYRGVGSPSVLEWCPDEKRLIVKARNEYTILDLSGGIRRLYGHRSKTNPDARWSPDGGHIATTSYDGTARIWDGASGEQLLVFEEHSGAVGYLSWSPDGERIVTSASDEPSLVWNADTGKVLLELDTPLPDNFFWVPAWSPDGERIVTTRYPTYGAVVWNATSGEFITATPNMDCLLFGLDWSPNGDFFVTGCALAEGDTPALIWDASSGELVLALESQDGTTMQAEWSPDGERIAAAYEGRVAKVWQLFNSAGDVSSLYRSQRSEIIAVELVTFAAHQEIVSDVAWSPDGRRVASGDQAGLLKVWDAASGDEVLSFTVPDTIARLDWSPDGKHLVVTGQFYTPVVLPVWQSTEELIEHAKACCVSRELTPEERVQFGLPERE